MTDLDWPNEPLRDVEPIERTRDAMRSARKREVRAETISMKRLTKAERLKRQSIDPDDGRRRLPLTRGDCEQVERPCPYISCRYHLFLDVNPKTGSIKLNYPDLMDHDGAPELEYLNETCVLDIADRGGVTLEDLGEIMNMTRERIRQIEERTKTILHENPTLTELFAHGIEPFDKDSIYENPRR
jgi:Sigma-70, region 4